VKGLREVKVLHMADTHLEWPFVSAGGDGPRGRMRREELKAVFAGIIDLAAREGVQVLLAAGDLFEEAHVTRATVKFIDDQFRRIPDVAVFISPGNHDPYLEGSYWQTYPWAPNVHIFGPEPALVDLEHLPVSVCGWGFGAWEVRQWQLGGLRMGDPARINLAVFHGGEGSYHPFTPADLAALGADYIALGHIHKEGVVLEQGGRVVARYSGSPEALGFGEPGVHGVCVGTVGKERSRWAFVPTGRRQYITTDLDVSGAISLEDVAAAAGAVDDEAQRQQHCYRLRLSGRVDPELAVDVALLQEKLAGQFYLLRLEDATEPDYDLEALARERSARGLFVQRLLAAAAQARDEAGRQQVRRALALGLGAFAGAPGKGGGL
jgi:DNA repair protein SbcD/Mre11